MGLFYQITDDAFPGAKSIDFIGQRIVYVEPFGRYWGWSDLVDASSWNSLETAQAETSPDRIQGLIVSHNEVLIFGERTIEPWASAPTDTAVFQLQVGSVIESGCAAGKTIKRLDNSVFYLTNSGQVARLDGYTPRIVSTMAVDSDIRERNWSKAFAFTWEDNGHAVYYITFPDGHTWGYDARQDRWHRRESFGLDRWRVNALVKSNRTWFAGDFQNGRIYELEWGNVYEGCEIMPRKLRTGVLHNAQNRIPIHGFQVVASSGVPATVGATTAPVVYPQHQVLVSGSAIDTGGPLLASALAEASPVFSGIAQATGATIAGGAPAYHDGTWVVHGMGVTDSAVASTDQLVTWSSLATDRPISGYMAPGADGWIAVGGNGGYDNTAKANPIASGFSTYEFATEHPPGTALRPFGQGNESYMCRKTANYYWIDTGAQGELVRTTDITLATQQVIFQRGVSDSYIFLDIEEFGGDVYAAIYNANNLHAQIRKSSDGGATWPTLVVDIATFGVDAPVYLKAGNGVLLALSRDCGTVWTSADNFAASRSTGISGDVLANPPIVSRQGRGPMMDYASGYFFIVSPSNGTTPALGNKCVTTADGLTFGAAASLPITSVTGIATSSEPTVNDPPQLDECTPMESGTFQLRYSDDGANNYSNWRDFAYPTTGQFMQPLIARRLGMTRHRVWEIMDTSNRPQEILAASIILE